MPYVGDELILGRNSKLTAQKESTYGVDPGDPTQDHIIPFETASIATTPEQIQAETIRQSRSKNRKDNTIWLSEGDAEALWRGGRTTGADPLAITPETLDALPEGIHHLLEAHFGTRFLLAPALTDTGCTTTTLKTPGAGFGNYEPGDLVVWYDDTIPKLQIRFIREVTDPATVVIWPPLDVAEVPPDLMVIYGLGMYRYAGTKVLHPSLTLKAYDGDVIKRTITGVKVPTLDIEIPLAEYATFSFGFAGQKGTDPILATVPSGVTGPRNPNFPAVGLDTAFLYIGDSAAPLSDDPGVIYGVTPLSLSISSSFEVHNITGMDDVNTPHAIRLGMRDVTATLEVLYDDPQILKDFRAGRRISILGICGRDSLIPGASWPSAAPKAYNAFAFGLQQLSIDSVDMPDQEDEKKLTLTLTSEPGDLGIGRQMNFDQELVLAALGGPPAGV